MALVRIVFAFVFFCAVVAGAGSFSVAAAAEDSGPPLKTPSTVEAAQKSFESARAHYVRGELDQAIQTLDEAIKLDPKFADAYALRGFALAWQGKFELAVAEFTKAIKLRKNDEAVAAYTKAAAMDPNPATAYFNLCATQYNIGNTGGALNACGKAIAVDPNKADAYFIKGSVLMAESTVTKDGKTLAPAGTVEALKKYLQLAPNGGHAADAKQMLDYLDGKPEADGDSQKLKSKAQ